MPKPINKNRPYLCPKTLQYVMSKRGTIPVEQRFQWDEKHTAHIAKREGGRQ